MKRRSLLFELTVLLVTLLGDDMGFVARMLQDTGTDQPAIMVAADSPAGPMPILLTDAQGAFSEVARNGKPLRDLTVKLIADVPLPLQSTHWGQPACHSSRATFNASLVDRHIRLQI